MLNIIHFVIDDKFIDGAISLFESDHRVNNTYAIFRSIGGDYKYINYPNIINVDKSNVFDHIKSYDVVILHTLRCIPLSVVCKIPYNVRVVWLAWGYDIYNDYLIKIKLYGPLTSSCINRRPKVFRFHPRRYLQSKLYLKKAISRIDFFSGVFPYEYDLLKQYRREFSAKPLDFYYGSTSFFVPEHPVMDIDHGRTDFIIGNSADPSNNHLDVLNLLKKRGIPGKSRIIMPLSYNDSDYYVSTVEKEANCLAPGRVVVLRKFIPLDNYIKLISGCKVAIFAHERQQASDNIFMQLLYGARVYMSESSLAFHYLKNMGLKLYSLQGDLDLINEDMSDEDIITNRRILSDHYSTSKLLKRIIVINNNLLGI